MKSIRPTTLAILGFALSGSVGLAASPASALKSAAAAIKSEKDRLAVQSTLVAFEEAYMSFTSGEFEFGAQASAVAINAGVSAAASTSAGATAGVNVGSTGAQLKTNYTNGMAVSTRTKRGLMYEAALGGQKFKFKARKN